MWRFKPFMHKEHTGLEGRTVDIGSYKVQVGNVIAEGGFSTVYLTQDAVDSSKQYALKHIIFNDEESKDIVMKEISVMKTLKGHPNVVTLYSHVIFDTGRSKEALLLMEYCEKSLVGVLESRGSGFFEEKQILKIFRDVCNAVFSMHCQTPAIAHRDLKAENLLLGSDGLWKLCDFGSTSTNHKRFLKPEEMGIEEDNIRKHTTPAYRAPEMWDLYRRELINEKVDIWALGCLLFRICYLKLAFDGESKLQVLNGNYRIPDLPKYNVLLIDLIREMLQSSPDDRPDITQVWFRVNDLLPDGLRKSLPDKAPEMLQNGTDVSAGMSKSGNKSSPMPRRSPPPPPSDVPRNVSPAPNNVRTGTGESTSALGSFWNTHHAKEAQGSVDNTRPKYDEETIMTYQTDAFNALAELNIEKERFNNNYREPQKNELLEAEVEKLSSQLAQASAEKADILSKYEKLSAICRSQRQEIQELQHALAARTPSPSSDSLRNAAPTGSQSSPIPLIEKMDGTTTSPDAHQWQAFTDDTKPNSVPTKYASKSVRTRNSWQKRQAAEPASGANTWGFETDGFNVVPASRSKSDTPTGESYGSYGIGKPKNGESKLDNQPAGWAGF